MVGGGYSERGHEGTFWSAEIVCLDLGGGTKPYTHLYTFKIGALHYIGITP